jgi:hypothetical protein
MAATPNPPIVLVEDQDVMVFKSVKEAEWFVEGWVVKEGRLRGFDADGHLLRFEVESRSVGGRLGRWLNMSRDETQISLAPGDATAGEDLRDLLIAFLRTATSSAPQSIPELALLPLATLVQRAARYAQR